jgi:aminoglycoside 6'-N-acetyltransferase
MASASCTFEPVAEVHLPLLRRWLAEPHVQTCRGDPEPALTTSADHMACETCGIDQFIGEPSLVDCGHGSAFVDAFVADLFGAGAPRVITDPNPRNARAYEKAGFRALDDRRTIAGDALLMSNDAGNL